MAKYKVGDKVRVKSRGWYKENKDKYGDVKCTLFFFSSMAKYCGKPATITQINDNGFYRIDIAKNLWWSEEMFEDTVQEHEICHNRKPVSNFFIDLSIAINKVVSENKLPIMIEEKDGSIIITPIETDEM